MSRLSRFLVIVFSLIATITARGAVNPTVSFYVSTTGKDSNPGTEKQPFLTLQHAADVHFEQNFKGCDGSLALRPTAGLNISDETGGVGI